MVTETGQSRNGWVPKSAYKYRPFGTNNSAKPRASLHTEEKDIIIIFL